MGERRRYNAAQKKPTTKQMSGAETARAAMLKRQGVITDLSGSEAARKRLLERQSRQGRKMP